jgi:hypothetical protein
LIVVGEFGIVTSASTTCSPDLGAMTGTRYDATTFGSSGCNGAVPASLVASRVSVNAPDELAIALPALPFVPEFADPRRVDDDRVRDWCARE